MSFKVSEKRKCDHCFATTYPGSKAHGKLCTNCGTIFCSPDSPRRTCGKPECASRRKSAGAQAQVAVWPRCSKCGERTDPRLVGNKSHKQACVICSTIFCPGRPDGATTCSPECGTELQSRSNSAKWEKLEYREKQVKARSAQAGHESRESRAARAALGIAEREIPKFGFNWDGWWPDRQIFYEYMGCNWHFCDSCGKNNGSPECIKRRALDARKLSVATDGGWCILYVWSHDLPDLLRDSKAWLQAKLGFDPTPIVLPPEMGKSPVLCSQCPSEARPKLATCSEVCAHAALVASGKAAIVTRHAGDDGCPNPKCGSLSSNPDYHNKTCRNPKCGIIFCVENSTSKSNFCTIRCYHDSRKPGELCTDGGKPHPTNGKAHLRKCEQDGCEERFCSYGRHYCPAHTAERIKTANSASAKAQWADPEKRAKIVKGLKKSA